MIPCAAMKHLLVCLLCIGCRTEFTGSPHVDPASCVAKCQASQLVMTGMVYMGEYSSACICEVPRAAPAPSAPPGAGAGAAAGAAAGVAMQMRRDEEARQRNQR
jgi:hypothetical protein